MQVKGPAEVLPGFEPTAQQISSQRYSSSAAWRTLIVKRREACLAQNPSTPLFLDTLLDNLRDAVSLAFSHPPLSAQDLKSANFFSYSVLLTDDGTSHTSLASVILWGPRTSSSI